MTDTALTNGAAESKDTGPVIRLRRLERIRVDIPIVSRTPLIVSRFSEKAKQMMLEAQQSSVKKKKEPKDPVANFELSRYRLPDGRDGFPAVGFKAAIVGAARKFDGVTMTALKQAIFVQGIGPEQLVPINGQVTIREDAVRNATGVADLRHRACYPEWETTLTIEFIKNQFDLNSLYALVDAAGFGGIGEWRPSAPKSLTGTYGMFEVKEVKP